MRRLTDPDFQYTPSSEQGPDYLARKFRRIRAQMKEQAEAQAKAEAERGVKVRAMRSKP